VVTATNEFITRPIASAFGVARRRSAAAASRCSTASIAATVPLAGL